MLTVSASFFFICDRVRQISVGRNASSKIMKLGSSRHLGGELILKQSQTPAAVSSAETQSGSWKMTSVLIEDRLRSLLWGIRVHEDGQGHALASLCRIQTCG